MVALDAAAAIAAGAEVVEQHTLAYRLHRVLAAIVHGIPVVAAVAGTAAAMGIGDSRNYQHRLEEANVDDAALPRLEHTKSSAERLEATAVVQARALPHMFEDADPKTPRSTPLVLDVADDTAEPAGG